MKLTVDVILYCISNTSFLFVKRKHQPYANYLAFPGGFLEENETLKEGAARELREETGVDIYPERLKLQMFADEIDRDPRERIISCVFYTECYTVPELIRQNDEVDDLIWLNLNQINRNLYRFAFDHKKILDLFLINPYHVSKSNNCKYEN